MAKTATERSRVLRERRACGKVVLTVVLGDDELAEIAGAGYAEASSTDRKDGEAAVTLFLSDARRHFSCRRPGGSVIALSIKSWMRRLPLSRSACVAANAAARESW